MLQAFKSASKAQSCCDCQLFTFSPSVEKPGLFQANWQKASLGKAD